MVKKKKQTKRKLNFGCGNVIMPGYTNIDIVAYPGVDVVHNFETYPYPFKDNTFDEIFCSHVLEHMYNLNKVIDELWRISKNGAIIRIVSPHGVGPIYTGDISHKTIITYRSFENYNIDNPHIKVYLTNFGSKTRFKILKRKIIFSEHARIFGFRVLAFMDFFINLAPRLYERLFCYILPSEMIYIELQVVK